MKLTSSPVSISSLVLSDEQSAVRTAGCHVSAIIRKIEMELGRKKANSFTEDDLDHFALIGRLWEAQLAAAMFQRPRYERVGELEIDGIIGSPDVFDTEECVVGEIKATYASAAHDIRDRWGWFVQIMAYCYMLQVQRAFLVVLFVCGEWRPPVPSIMRWDIEFGRQELRDNWLMLQRNREDACA